MATVIAETTRGGITESIHHGIVAVSDAHGEIVARAGDVDHVIFTGHQRSRSRRSR